MSTAVVSTAPSGSSIIPGGGGGGAGGRTARRKQRCWLFQVDGVTSIGEQTQRHLLLPSNVHTSICSTGRVVSYSCFVVGLFSLRERRIQIFTSGADFPHFGS